MNLTLRSIEEAKRRISKIATVETPLKQSLSLSERLGRPVSLKIETVQATGAFKLRGASNAVLSLPPEVRERGLVTASSGNHGRAIAYVANKLGIPAVICLSELVPEARIKNIARLGASVEVGGKDQDAAMDRAHEIEQTKGMTFISPFDDINVIAGQATIGAEIVTANPDVDTIVVPMSGGGLLGGVAFAAKALKPDVKVVGVSMERGAALYHSLKAGKPIIVEELETIADALQGGVGLDNQHSFELCNQFVDETYVLSEEQIVEGIRHAFFDERLVLEGSGACGIALLLDQQMQELGKNIVTVCSGDNIDPNNLLNFLAR